MPSLSLRSGFALPIGAGTDSQRFCNGGKADLPLTYHNIFQHKNFSLFFFVILDFLFTFASEMSNIRTYEITHCEQKVFPIQQKDSTDYFIGGSLVMKNGKIDKILFDGGYAQASVATKTTDKFAFNFYNQDHLGNNREVVNAKGVVQQVTNYYPFGAPYADATAVKGAAVQPYKYNGKELDLMHGLNTYDYGARQYNPVTARWDRIDRFCEKYYSTSPYAYCANNPIKYIDLHGDSLTLDGEANDVDLGVGFMNGSASSTYKNDNGNIVISKVGTNPNAFDAHFNKIINSDINVRIKVVNNSENVLIGDADAATIDVGDMSNLPDNPVVNASSSFLHEAKEQYYIQAEGRTKDVAHKRASGDESSVGMYTIPEDRLIDPDAGTLTIQAQHKLNETNKTITIKINNNNIVK